MKRILLINPPQENILPAGIEDDFIDMIGYYPPLGLMYIATVLKQNNYDVKIIDCVPMKYGYAELEQEIRNFKPFVVGITTYTMSLVDVLLTAKLVKKVSNEIKVVLGGHHVMLYPKESLKYDYVDFILRGEGDYTFLKLVENIERNASIDELKKIEGIGFNLNGKIFYDLRAATVENLDDLPIVDRELLPKELYSSIVGKEKLVATVMSSRGCPYKCTFCYTPSKIYRSRSTENIMNELKYLYSLGYKDIFFFDDLFALKPQKVIEIAEAIKKSGLKINWSFRGRINTVTEEMIEKIKDSGIHRIQFGIESGVDKTLKRIKKGITTEKIRKVIKWCNKAKITTIGNFMIGLPDETKDDIEQTLKFSREIGLNYAQYSILVPYPFTSIYKEGLERKIFTHDFWQEFVDNPFGVKNDFKVQYWTENVSEEYLFRVIKKSFKRFYFRPKIIWNRLRELNTFQELIFSIIGAFKVLVFSPKPKTIKNLNV